MAVEAIGSMSRMGLITRSDVAAQPTPPSAAKSQNEGVGTDPRNWTPTPDGPLRPKLPGVPIPLSHPLYAFFRFQETAVEQEEDAEGRKKKKIHRYYTTLEAPHEENDQSGRAWLASELRHKSFRDLHTLWYVLARERNLLATQMLTARRLGLDPKQSISGPKKDVMCRKSMARIKQVLNERRLAYLGAVEVASDHKSPNPLKTTAELQTQRVKNRRHRLRKKERMREARKPVEKSEEPVLVEGA
ncbi:hypothetical protein BS47DRAFT_1348720 [Hydnum rufescens UP504]|uniref:Large ribosomal subunit protein uL29m n=1 Tax=Hydnum rufescens UP504 TaxID=1448309 RepID=A0A9P6AQ23_9AGAM|nr:hypothetical protein BS47DRAFT_1348720 [Hydnum rufescens UP504]